MKKKKSMPFGQEKTINQLYWQCRGLVWIFLTKALNISDFLEQGQY